MAVFCPSARPAVVLVFRRCWPSSRRAGAPSGAAPHPAGTAAPPPARHGTARPAGACARGGNRNKQVQAENVLMRRRARAPCAAAPLGIRREATTSKPHLRFRGRSRTWPDQAPHRGGHGCSKRTARRAKAGTRRLPGWRNSGTELLLAFRKQYLPSTFCVSSTGAEGGNLFISPQQDWYFY